MLASIARVISRSRALFASSSRVRLFSFQAESVTSLLARRTQARPGVGKQGTTLALLLHADRRPQQNGTFFGPSLLLCEASKLKGSPKGELDEGDLGTLRLQRNFTSEVSQAAICPHQGLTPASAENALAP